MPVKHRRIVIKDNLIITSVAFEWLDRKLRVRSFRVIWFRITDPRSLRIMVNQMKRWSTLVTDLSVPVMYYDPSDLWTLIRLILTQITPKASILSLNDLQVKLKSAVKCFQLLLVLDKIFSRKGVWIVSDTKNSISDRPCTCNKYSLRK